MRSIVRIAAVAIACTVASARGAVSPLDTQADLNTFMKEVLARRDDNWKKLQEFILDETEKIEVRGLGNMPVWGQKREYQWFIREGFFVKSPVTSDGVKIGEADRQKYEDQFFERQKAREKRRAEEAAKKAAEAPAGEAPPPPPVEAGGGVDAIIKQTAQPQFIDSAYFMEFTFEGGQYALAGKEQFEGHDVLRIEYYPTRLFDVDGSDNKRKADPDKKRDPKSKGAQFEKALEHLMNKNSMVTIWVEPKSKQIVKYTFDNVQLDYFPAAWLARMEALRASMTMSEPFKGVWLPRDMEFEFSALLAVGPFEVRYRIDYHDYREAITSGRIKKAPEPETQQIRPPSRPGRCGGPRPAGPAIVAPLLLAAALVAGGLSPLPQQGREVIAGVLVHANQVVSTEEILTLALVKVGDPFTDKTIAEVTARLKASGKFESVEVRKRYASIEDMSQITLVILASEGSVRIDLPQVPGGEVRVVNRTVWRNLMFMPILDGEDGYGFTYGVRVAYPQPIGTHSRLSFPLTWGGTRRAGVELDRTFKSGAISRMEFGGAIQNKRNPAYDIRDGRHRVWARAERVMGPVRLGSTGGYQRVSFAEVIDHFTSISGDATLDTRLDPVLPRNAVYVNASIEHVMFGDTSTTLPAGDGTSLNRMRLDARGYVGLFGQQVLVARVLGEDVDRPAPLYLRSLLGGWSNLRGFEAGFRTGDTLLATSLEWRMPITSPLSSFGKMGVSVFVDWGTAYDHGQQLRDQKWDQGAGAAVWLTVTAFRMSVGVAHGKGSGTRVNFGGGLTF